MIFGVTPFESLSAAAIAAMMLLYVSAFTLRGVLGFGSATPAVLGGVWLVPPHDAVILAAMASLGAQLLLLPRGIRTCDRKIMPPMILGAGLSIILGTWIFANLKAEWLTIAIGAILILAVLAERFKITERAIQGRDLRSFKVPFCLTSFSGLLSGIGGVGANFLLSVYIRWAAPNPTTFRGTNMAYSGFTVVWRTLALTVGGLLSMKLLVESVLLVPAVLLGSWLGLKLGDRIDAARYFHIVEIVLVLAAMTLFWKGYTALS
jgi:uncharacterized membrane protein YfcA